ncbi:MAG: (2S)-3-sulfopropanediol dehydratase, partial [Bacilli bacterium]
MSEKHTNARGTEPYDITYSLGYEVNHKDWSPYPRVNRLRQKFLDRQYWIEVERLRLVTKAYQEHENSPDKLKAAYAFEKVLLNTTLEIYDEDLILGEIAAPAKASPIYPEFSVNWIIDEILNSPFEERSNDQFYIRNDEDRKEIVELCRYWQGKNVDDLINARLEEDQIKGSEVGKKIFQTNVYHYAGVGHLVIDYAMLLENGYDGMIAKTQRAYDNLDKRDPEYGDKRDFYQAVLIMHNAAKKYILRYSALASEKALVEKDPKRKAELEAMALNTKQIAGGVPQTFWQAMQLFNFVTTMIQIEGNGHSISYGRMDQWLHPYYQADIESGNLTKEFALEIIEVQFVKMNNPTKLKDKGTVAVRNGRGFGGESLTIGGVDENGNDITNDLTMLILEGSAHTRMMNPWVCVRMHENTPYELKVKTVEVTRAGYGHPKIFNDAPAIKGMMRKGMSLEEARQYAVVGCVEPSLPGHEFGWHDAAYVNTAKMMEMVINGGRCLDCSSDCFRWDICGFDGGHIGLDTGSLENYKSFDDVLVSVDKQFEYWT